MDYNLNKKNIFLNEDLPIEFKQLNVNDFEGYDVKNNVKSIINISENGYIYDTLLSEIDLDESNTVAINAAVGQGKSFAVNSLALKYYNRVDNEARYKVFIVVPFKDLIDQYKKGLVDLGVPEFEILDYRKIAEIEDTNSPFFHLITVNSLLGNFGENAIAQSKLKRNYQLKLQKYCNENSCKVIFFIDEIHDSIKNFKEIFIFNLLKWRGLTHKVFVSSATYNETSKIVIKYLSELTDYKIQLIESVRERIESKISRLHLFFENQHYYSPDNKKILSLLEKELDKGKKPHILTSTKSLAERFCGENSKVKELIESRGFKTNLCIGTNSKLFDEELCNIGTTFKTGRSITGQEAVYFLILPAKGEINQNTIFSDGVNSIIQSLARPRRSIDIYVILPFPDKLIEPLEQSNGYIEYMKYMRKSYYNEYAYMYHPLSNQHELLENFYDENLNNFRDEINSLNESNRNGKPRLEFPPFEIFSLEYGEKYFSLKFPIFGSDISAYVTWASFNNQFYNCKLHSIIYSDFENVKEGEVQLWLEDFFNAHYEVNSQRKSAFFELNSDLFCFNDLRKKIFQKLVYYTDANKKRKKITNNISQKFNRHILSFIQRKKASINWYFRDKFYLNSSFLEGLRDYEYTVEDYIRASISVSVNLDNKNNEQEILLKETYLQLYNVKEEFKDKFIFIDDNIKPYLLKDKSFISLELMSNDFYSRLVNIVSTLKQRDANLKMFSFFQGFNSDDKERTTKQIYSFLRTVFFHTKNGRINSEQFPNEDKANIIIKEFEFDSDVSLNLIYEPEDAWLYQSGNGIVEYEGGTYLPYKGYRDVEWGFNPSKEDFDINLVINSSTNIEYEADITEIDEEE